METRFDGLVEIEAVSARLIPKPPEFVGFVWGSARVYIFDNCRTQWTINYHEEDSEVVKAYIRNLASS